MTSFTPRKFDRDFEHQDGWRISLFRDNNDIDGYLNDARAILTGNFTELADMGLNLGFKPGGWNASFEVQFDAPPIAAYDAATTSAQH